MIIQFSYPMNPDGSGRMGSDEHQYADLPEAPRKGETVVIDGTWYEVRHVEWYPFGGHLEEIKGPLVYVVLSYGGQ